MAHTRHRWPTHRQEKNAAWLPALTGDAFGSLGQSRNVAYLAGGMYARRYPPPATPRVVAGCPHRLGLRRTVLPQPDRQDRDQADGQELALKQVVFRTARVSLGWIASNGPGMRNVQM